MFARSESPAIPDGTREGAGRLEIQSHPGRRRPTAPHRSIVWHGARLFWGLDFVGARAIDAFGVAFGGQAGRPSQVNGRPAQPPPKHAGRPASDWQPQRAWAARARTAAARSKLRRCLGSPRWGRRPWGAAPLCWFRGGRGRANDNPQVARASQKSCVTKKKDRAARNKDDATQLTGPKQNHATTTSKSQGRG